VTDTSKDKKTGSYMEFSGTGPNLDRQDVPHPHEAYVYNNELLVPDLGADKTWRLVKGSTGWEVGGAIEYPAGSGPRHLVVHGMPLLLTNYILLIPLFHPDGIIYTLLELTNQLSLQKYAALPEAPTHITSISTFASGICPDPSSMFAAEILLAPNKKFLYVSNRDDPSPEGDTIAVFSLPTDPKECKIVREIRTGVKHARGMSFSRDGKYLAVAGSQSGAVKIFEVVQESGDGEVKLVASIEGFEKPTAPLWL
jgi:6-phosphogluconolactonase (cycloisomerase 2 family)